MLPIMLLMWLRMMLPRLMLLMLPRLMWRRHSATRLMMMALMMPRG